MSCTLINHDYRGAWLLLQQLTVDDPHLRAWRDFLAATVNEQDNEAQRQYPTDQRSRAPPLQHLRSYQRLPDADWTPVASAWIELQQQLEPRYATDAYVRFLAITSNEVESVFNIGSDRARIVRAGISLPDRVHIAPGYDTDDPQQIADILVSSQKALQYVQLLAENGRKNESLDWLNAQLIIDVHRILMQHSRLQTGRDGTRYLVPTGFWRRSNVLVTPASGVPLFFHRPSDVAANVERMIDMIRSHLRHGSGSNPFIAAAWLHHMLISIHPFQDGNGRTTRIIASIPLLLADLPPISIDSQAKPGYYRALDSANAGDLYPLVQELMEQALRAIAQVRAFCSKQ
ncbi:hypothetical protein RI367_004747 [Sorochytrium milnesiophthora]